MDCEGDMRRACTGLARYGECTESEPKQERDIAEDTASLRNLFVQHGRRLRTYA
jgi:hypothetical protein